MGRMSQGLKFEGCRVPNKLVLFWGGRSHAFFGPGILVKGTCFMGPQFNMGVSENRGPSYSTLNSRIPYYKDPKIR